MIYGKTDEAGGDHHLIFPATGGPARSFPSTDFATTPPDFVHSDQLWLPGGRLVTSKEEPGGVCSYWDMHLDPRTAKPLDKLHRLSDRTGPCLLGTSATKDGKYIALMASTRHSSIYVADLEGGGTRLSNLRHFTLSQTDDTPDDWTADSKALIFGSNQDGFDRVYKQSLDSDTSEGIATGAVKFIAANMSPDGKWIVGIRWPRPGDHTFQIVRVPITGGSPEVIFSVQQKSWMTLFCAKPPSNLCATAEPTEDRKQLVMTAFDPIKGRGAELARFDLDQNEGAWFCVISPDGTRFAVIRGPKGPIHILTIRDRLDHVVPAKDLNNIASLNWAADGKALFVSNVIKDGTALYHVDFMGNTKFLWKSDGGGENDENHAPASPDGRHIAIKGWDVNSNIWFMENF
jgi:Tol biopolymer transport system component